MRFLAQAPAMPFVVQEYVEPDFGYVTRIEVVDDELPLIAKRSIGEGGLSSYHAGSTYELYPDCPDAVRQTALRARCGARHRLRELRRHRNRVRCLFHRRQ